MNLFEAERPRRIEIAADQEDVSSVVVLKAHSEVSPISHPSLCFIELRLRVPGGDNRYIKSGRGGAKGEREAYSFAKTPLKAAQAPLAAARANHEGDVKLILLLGGGGGRREPWVGVKRGRRGSAAASIEDIFRGGGRQA